jgi:mono/diheme cytochrome c family protein
MTRARAVACALGLALASLGCEVDVDVKRLPAESPIVVNVPASGQLAASDLPVSVDVLVEGARIFDERCSPCHGETGRGDGPLAEVVPIAPRDYRHESFKWGTRPSQIVATIRQGRSGVMPPFEGELTPHQIWAVAWVVWSWIPPERREMDDADALRRLR